MLVTNMSARLYVFHQEIHPGKCVDVPEEVEIESICPETRKKIKTKIYPAKSLRASGSLGTELLEGDLTTKLPAPKRAIKGLRDMSESNAIAMVSTETDKELLQSWGDVEERQDVLKAIAARYQQLGGK